MREANETWPGGCQSCVSRTFAKRGAMPVDDRDHVVAVRNRERAARQEVVLDIDDQKNRVLPHQPTALPISSTTFFASPNTIIVFGM